MLKHLPIWFDPSQWYTGLFTQRKMVLMGACDGLKMVGRTVLQCLIDLIVLHILEMQATVDIDFGVSCIYWTQKA